MTTVWKDINGYEGFYQVSNLGNIKSLERTVKAGRYTFNKFIPERILKPCNVRDGYSRVVLNKQGDIKSKLVHRLVAEMFIDNPENKKEVNHKSGDKNDNTVSNLEWNTAIENIRHAYVNGLKKGTNGERNNKSRWVLNTVIGVFYESIKEASIASNLDYGTLVKQLAGKRLNNTTFIYI